MSIKYSEDFKKSVVTSYETSGKSASLIAMEYGIARSTVLQWVKLSSKECPHLKSHTTSMHAHAKKISDMQKRIAELELENEFLKKASAFFVTTIE